MKKSANESATEILDLANRYGWNVNVRGSIMTITKRIAAGNNDAFCQADSEYYSILGALPRTSAGSDWGTDGGGIGALTAMNSGTFTMNRSGGSKRVLSALRKMI